MDRLEWNFINLDLIISVMVGILEGQCGWSSLKQTKDEAEDFGLGWRSLQNPTLLSIA
jgi:hypothetical protein